MGPLYLGSPAPLDPVIPRSLRMTPFRFKVTAEVALKPCSPVRSTPHKLMTSGPSRNSLGKFWRL